MSESPSTSWTPPQKNCSSGNSWPSLSKTWSSPSKVCQYLKTHGNPPKKANQNSQMKFHHINEKAMVRLPT